MIWLFSVFLCLVFPCFARLLLSIARDKAEEIINKAKEQISEKDESFEDIGFYHNTTGEWEASVSEELDEELGK